MDNNEILIKKSTSNDSHIGDFDSLRLKDNFIDNMIFKCAIFCVFIFMEIRFIFFTPEVTMLDLVIVNFGVCGFLARCNSSSFIPNITDIYNGVLATFIADFLKKLLKKLF